MSKADEPGGTNGVRSEEMASVQTPKDLRRRGGKGAQTDARDVNKPENVTKLGADDLQAVGWTGKAAKDQSTPRAKGAAGRKDSAGPESTATSVLRAVCCSLLKVFAGLGFLVVVLVLVLLALPDNELDGDNAAENMSGDAQMGNWNAAFFCEDELQRAGRIMKSTNYIVRTAGMSHGHSNETEACMVVRKALVSKEHARRRMHAHAQHIHGIA